MSSRLTRSSSEGNDRGGEEMAGDSMSIERSNSPPLLEWGVAARAHPGQTVSGDLPLVEPFPGGVLVAALDGVGHGEAAASVARLTVATLRQHAREPIVALLQRCHDTLRETRGVMLTLVSLDAVKRTITWVGVGSVEGVLLHAASGTAAA